MKPLLLFAAFLSLGCGQKYHAHVDEALEKYVQAFETEEEVSASNTSVSFGDTTAPMIGFCQLWDDGHGEITIDSNFWTGMDESGREELIYHELGHCVLGYDHENEMITLTTGDRVQGSIMNAYWFGDAWNYLSFQTQYKTALKDNRAMNPLE